MPPPAITTPMRVQTLISTSITITPCPEGRRWPPTHNLRAEWHRSARGCLRHPHRVFGGLKRHRRVELPLTQAPFDLFPVVSRGGEASRQASGAAAHLFGFGETLFGQPGPVALLERFGQSVEVTQG